MSRILVVDDEESICWSFRELLGDEADDDAEKVIRVYDTEEKAILYAEIAGQECFLARI